MLFCRSFKYNFLGMQMSYFRKAIEDMASDSLRCVAIAYRPFEDAVPDTEEQLAHWSLPEDGLVLLAIVGIKVCIFFRNMPTIFMFVILFLTMYDIILTVLFFSNLKLKLLTIHSFLNGFYACILSLLGRRY